MASISSTATVITIIFRPLATAVATATSNGNWIAAKNIATMNRPNSALASLPSCPATASSPSSSASRIASRAGSHSSTVQMDTMIINRRLQRGARLFISLFLQIFYQPAGQFRHRLNRFV